MKALVRFIRIYTPLICTIMVLINGLLISRGNIPEDFIFLSSATTGHSILVIMYFFVTTLRMCIWYRLNLLCLLLIQLCGIAYNYMNIEFSLYVNALVLLSILGILFFLIFKVFYKVTGLLLCIHRY